MIDAFCEENPNATREEWHTALGTPEELAAQLMELYTPAPLRPVSKTHLLRLVELAVVLSLSIALAAILFYQYLMSNNQIEINPITYIYLTSDPSTFDKEG